MFSKLSSTFRFCDKFSSKLSFENFHLWFGLRGISFADGRRGRPDRWSARAAALTSSLHTCAHSYAWHDSFMCVAWGICMRDMSRMCDTKHFYACCESCVWHEAFICVAWVNRSLPLRTCVQRQRAWTCLHEIESKRANGERESASVRASKWGRARKRERVRFKVREEEREGKRERDWEKEKEGKRESVRERERERERDRERKRKKKRK